MIWKMKHPQATPEMLGYIPSFLNDDDPRPAKEQLDTNYRQGGGWIPFPGFKMLPNGDLAYPGDPPMKLLAETVLHADGGTIKPEVIRFYDCSWVAIIQVPDGSYEICRMD